jgi:hypothetical protein
MPTQPRFPAEHDAASERLIRAVQETPGNAPQLAIAHALRAAAPRRARRSERAEHHPNQSGSPQQRWLYGRDDQDDES